MLPLSLDVTRLRLVLIGSGVACERRLALLDEAGARKIAVYAPAPSPALSRAAGARLHRHFPERDELAGAQLVFIADVVEPERSRLATAARAAGAILHVEDAPALSDSHAPAILRRGALTIAISTGGAAPGVAAEIKRFLAATLGPEWSGRVARLAALRQAWRGAGADLDTVRRLTAAQLGRYGWLKQGCVPVAANDCGTTTTQTDRGGLS